MFSVVNYHLAADYYPRTRGRRKMNTGGRNFGPPHSEGQSTYA